MRALGMGLTGRMGMRLTGKYAPNWPRRRRLVIAALVAICASAVGAASAHAAPPVNLTPPTISGNAVEGQTLTGTNGTWEDEGNLTFELQWRRSDGVGGYENIQGETGSTYVLTAADVGHTIRLRVTATNSLTEATTLASDPTAAVAAPPPKPPDNTSAPTISGFALEGETLTGANGDWDGEELTFTREWQRSDGPTDWDDIPGANGSEYTLTAADVGNRVRLAVTASNASGQETAFSAPTDPVIAAPASPQRVLELFVSRRLTAFKRATIRASGIAAPPVRLWVYENVRGKTCPAVPAERSGRTRTVIDGLEVGGAFTEKRRPKMKKPGRHAYCAYLGPNADTADAASFTTRKVRKPLLTATRAKRTVASALRRHGFADRVVANLEESCARRSRSEFQCRFASAFPGYLLRGLGSVERRKRVSYRFQVSIRGRSIVLTDENEGGIPG
jgi:hypothetical protein